jgi:hypothetical protein
MITSIETLVNDYWMYDKEPFYIIRFKENGKTYLFGKTITDSRGIKINREQRNWLEPSNEQIGMVENILQKSLAS